MRGRVSCWDHLLASQNRKIINRWLCRKTKRLRLGGERGGYFFPLSFEASSFSKMSFIVFFRLSFFESSAPEGASSSWLERRCSCPQGQEQERDAVIAIRQPAWENEEEELQPQLSSVKMPTKRLRQRRRRRRKGEPCFMAENGQISLITTLFCCKKSSLAKVINSFRQPFRVCLSVSQTAHPIPLGFFVVFRGWLTLTIWFVLVFSFYSMHHKRIASGKPVSGLITHYTSVSIESITQWSTIPLNRSFVRKTKKKRDDGFNSGKFQNNLSNNKRICRLWWEEVEVERGKKFNWYKSPLCSSRSIQAPRIPFKLGLMSGPPWKKRHFSGE